jgi:predicted peroxiredoxin
MSRMAKLLVHIATGPENPTRAALGLLIARTAADEGHDVQETAAAATGIGTGPVAEHLESMRGAGVPLFLSGMSSKARGIVGGEGYELAPPQKLVELAAWSDTALVY